MEAVEIVARPTTLAFVAGLACGVGMVVVPLVAAHLVIHGERDSVADRAREAGL